MESWRVVAKKLWDKGYRPTLDKEEWGLDMTYNKDNMTPNFTSSSNRFNKAFIIVVFNEEMNDIINEA